MTPPVALTIAGSDSSGGIGIEADVTLAQTLILRLPNVPLTDGDDDETVVLDVGKHAVVADAVSPVFRPSRDLVSVGCLVR